jgi:hypothetical protein
MDMTAKRAEIEAANQDVRDYVLDLAARRRQQPGEDLVSRRSHRTAPVARAADRPKGDGPWAKRNRTRPAHAAGMQKGQPAINS